jgi:uncharacterized protein
MDTAPGPFPSLFGHAFLLLTTYRRDGRAVPTPVWFGQDGATVFVITDARSGKVKRIRHRGDVTVAPCTVDGTPLGAAAPAAAGLVADEATASRAQDVLAAKYADQFTSLVGDALGRWRDGATAFIAITAPSGTSPVA